MSVSDDSEGFRKVPVGLRGFVSRFRAIAESIMGFQGFPERFRCSGAFEKLLKLPKTA